MCQKCKKKGEVIPPPLLITRYDATLPKNDTTNKHKRKTSVSFIAENMLDNPRTKKGICNIINDTFGINNGGRLKLDYDSFEDGLGDINKFFGFNNEQQFDIIFNSQLTHSTEHTSEQNKWGVVMHLYSLKRLLSDKYWLNDEIINFVMKCFNYVELCNTVGEDVPR
mmetsp:Transcript_24620/g.30277  ORF Transcript_24620/g.30277 Transcript_24620/m.30277 type:complete len:167 (-) Transcript_24620:47-547(-)